MIYNNINTNLAGDCYKCLEEGVWEIGLISDNPGLDNIESDYYKTVKRENKLETQNSDHRCFKNKVLIKLLDGSEKTGHIIHWCVNGGYFCISNDCFWDQFED
jgi:hypothetical protein